MKITKEKLMEIIKEETASLLLEMTAEDEAASLGALLLRTITREKSKRREAAKIIREIFKTLGGDDALASLEDIIKNLDLGKAPDDFMKKGPSIPGRRLAPGEVNLTEDGHEDVPSAVRAMKTIIEDAGQILQALEGMDGTLPTWWTNKMAVASSKMNSMRDYLLVDSEEALEEEYNHITEATYDDGTIVEDLEFWDDVLEEAEYRGRKVTLNKPTRGDVKKFKVYVKDPKTGNVKKVNFGDPNMRIKKSNPKRRKSFRARHNCDNPGPKTKARYWSCKKW